MISEKILKERVEKLKREDLENFVLGILSNSALQPYLFTKKQVEFCKNVKPIASIEPFTVQGSEQLELVAKYTKTLKDLVNSLDFFSDKLGLTKFEESLISDLQNKASAEKSEATYEDLIKNK